MSTTSTKTHPPAFNNQTPPYLIDFIENLNIQSPLSYDDLSDIGYQALLQKINQTELENSALQSRHKKKIPETLSFFETAILLSHIIPFKNIYVSKESDHVLLGAYQTTGPREGTYDTNTENLYALVDCVSPKFRNQDIQEVLNKLRRISPTCQQTSNANLIIANNGVFDKKAKELKEFSPDFVYLAKLQIDYIPDAKNPIIIADDGYRWDLDSWIADLAEDDETNTLIWQVLADFIHAGITREKAIFFYSQAGNNGKGTIGQLLKNIVGKGNYSSLAMADFKHEFLKESLLGVTANIADENDVDQYIDSVRDFKASITGDDININRKFEKAIRLQFRGSNIQMINGLPKTRDRSDSFYRRIILVPFIKTFTNNGQRPDIKNIYIKRKDVLEYAVSKAFNLDFDEFIVPEKSKELLTDYKEANNPVLQFWAEFEHEFTWDLLPTQFLYDLFISWSSRTNPTGKPVSRQSFIDSLRQIAKDSNIWESKLEKADKIRTGPKMDTDEPLITEFQLKNWIDPEYAGTDLRRLRKFKRKNTYRGLIRV